LKAAYVIIRATANLNSCHFKNQAQVAPIYGIGMTDFTTNGYADLLMTGNYYNREVETTGRNAGIGCLLFGSESGEL
jgi:hypothetical protein